jgi:predicted DNA-binding ribbon-helix-helix protein
MKLKNLKAQNRNRSKTEDNTLVERLDEAESDQETSANDSSSKNVSCCNYLNPRLDSLTVIHRKPLANEAKSGQSKKQTS